MRLSTQAARRAPRPAPRRRWMITALLSSLMAVAGPGAAWAQGQPVIVGGKAFTEQYVLAEITKQALAKSGITAQTRVGYATDAIRQAQLSGEIDISWDYTWTGYAFHHGMKEPKAVDDVLAEVRALDEDNGLVWLNRTTVNNTYALAVNLDFAAENCIHSMDQLGQAIRNGLTLRLASDQECHKRDDCLLEAQRAYNFAIPAEQIEVMNVADTYDALRERRADLAVVYTTDGKIPAYDLELLEDPKTVFAEYYLTPVVTTTALEARPQIRGILERIARAMDTATSQDLHYRVDVVGQPVEQVARFFLTSKNL